MVQNYSHAHLANFLLFIEKYVLLFYTLVTVNGDHDEYILSHPPPKKRKELRDTWG